MDYAFSSSCRQIIPKTLIVLLVFLQQAVADDLRTERPPFEYEQCANAAQVDYDKDTSDCFKKLEAAKSKDESTLQQCVVVADKKLKSALRKCPHRNTEKEK